MTISAAKMGMGMGDHGGLGKSSRSSTNLKEIQVLDSCEGSLCFVSVTGWWNVQSTLELYFYMWLKAFLERIIWGGNIYSECGVTISWAGVSDWTRKRETGWGTEILLSFLPRAPRWDWAIAAHSCHHRVTHCHDHCLRTDWCPYTVTQNLCLHLRRFLLGVSSQWQSGNFIKAPMLLTMKICVCKLSTNVEFSQEKVMKWKTMM